MDIALGSSSSGGDNERDSGGEEAWPVVRDMLLLCVHERTGTVHGAVVAERIQSARAVAEDSDVVRCTGPPQEAALGVAKVFVYAAHRRRGVATRLLDAARCALVVGAVVPRDKTAFTQPTRDGRALFARYTGTPRFLVSDDDTTARTQPQQKQKDE